MYAIQSGCVSKPTTICMCGQIPFKQPALLLLSMYINEFSQLDFPTCPTNLNLRRVEVSVAILNYYKWWWWAQSDWCTYYCQL